MTSPQEHPPPPAKISSLPSSRQEEFAGWGSTSLLHKERCCLSLGTRFITASKTRALRDKKKKKKILRRNLGAVAQTQGRANAARSLARRERHKANNRRESWFRRQRRTSRTLILCDCSLLCTSKWHITVSVKKWLPGVKQPCFSLFFHPPTLQWTMEAFLVQSSGSQRGWACRSRPYSSGRRSNTPSEWIP